MAKFSVKYKIVTNGKSYPGTNGTLVTASNISEARQAFKYSHVDSADKKYVIVGVVKTGK